MPDFDGSVIDAPVLDGLDDQQVDDQAVDDGGSDDGNGDGVDDAAAAAAAAGGDAKQDERKLPQWIKDLKQANPAAFKEAKGVFFGKLAIDDKLKDFDLDGTKSFLEEHGGRESLATSLGEMRQDQAELQALREQAASGDRGLVDALAESPEGFAKLAPAVAEKWAQVDPEGWDHAMSGVFNATIQQSGVPMHIEKMGMQFEMMKYALESIPEQSRPPALVQAFNTLVQQLGTLKGWTGSFAEKAGKALQRQGGSAQTGKVDQREQALNERESQMFTQDLGRDVAGFRDPLIAGELKAFIERRPQDADARELAISTVRAKVIERMSADTKFQKDLNALCAKKDKAGALRLIKSRETAAIQEIAPKVGRTIFGNPGAAKAAVQQRQQRQEPRRQAAQDVDPRDAVLNRAFAR